MTAVTVVTGHVGPEWDEIAAVTFPGLRDYAGRHGYSLWDASSRLVEFADGRALSWGKVEALRMALYGGGHAVWVDADVVVSPGAPAIHEEPGVADAVQALVVHQTVEGEVPNCGVWVLGRGMRDVLREVWQGDTDHRWWEQAALLRLMGWDVDGFPVGRVADTDLWAGTAELAPEWNDLSGGAGSYMRHAAGRLSAAERLELLRAWAQEASEGSADGSTDPPARAGA